MALIKCPECKKEISNSADDCIHCGCPIGTVRPERKDVGVRVRNPFYLGCMIAMGICAGIVLFTLLLWGGGCAAVLGLIGLSSLNDIDTGQDLASPSESALTISAPLMTEELWAKQLEIEASVQQEYAAELSRKQGDVKRFERLLIETEKELGVARRRTSISGRIVSKRGPLVDKQHSLEQELLRIDNDIAKTQDVLGIANDGRTLPQTADIFRERIEGPVAQDSDDRRNAQSTWRRRLRNQIQTLRAQKVKIEGEIGRIDGELKSLNEQVNDENLSKDLQMLADLEDRLQNYRTRLTDAQGRVVEVKLRISRETEKQMSSHLRASDNFESDGNLAMMHPQEYQEGVTADSISPIRPPSSVSFSYLRSWKPHNDVRGFGAEVLLKDDLSEEELVAFVKFLTNEYDPVYLRIWLSEEAYRQDHAGVIDSPQLRSGLVLIYHRFTNYPSSVFFGHGDEIAWEQEVGKFSHKYGQRTKIE